MYGPIQTEWQIARRPVIYLIDANGVIQHKRPEPEALDKTIEALLKEHKKAGGRVSAVD